jgi:hypothetical protein
MFVLSVFVVCLLFIPAAPAQSMFATLSGTVTDSSGAVVVGADVTVKDVSSGEARKSATNQQGFFTFSTLPAATYELIVDARGFATYDVAGIVLSASDIRTTNISLKVATAAEKVVVKTLVEDISVVDSGEKSATIDAKTVQELSLVSRDASELVTLLPGAILTTNGGVNTLAVSGETMGMDTAGTIGNANINGQWVDTTFDGGHTFDAGKPGLKSPVTPNADMISEVKVLTSNFSADNPKGPVVMNAVSKSGSKDFHGDGRFYVRNSAMNANDAFDISNNIAKPNASYYYPGFGIGGPVIIPGTGINKGRQKLFFYDGFEYYKQQVDFGVNRAFVPDAKMLNGDFSELGPNGAGGGDMYTLPALPDVTTYCGGPCLAFVPYVAAVGNGLPTGSVSAARLAGCTITGGVMSHDCIDPEAQALMKAYLPAPTLTLSSPITGGFNYIADAVSPMNSYQNLARVDWNISDNTKVFVTYNLERQTATWPYGPWTMSGSDNNVVAPVPIIGGDRSDFLAATFMHVFSPTMTSESKFYYTFTSFPEIPQDPKKLLRAQDGGIPGFNLHGIFGPTTAPMVPSWGYSFPNLGAIGDSFQGGKLVYYSKLPSFEENLTKVMGTHTMKYGAYFEQVYHAQVNWSQFMGVYQYGYGAINSIVGNNYADVLMGISQNAYFEQAQPPTPVAINVTLFDFYAQDDWKVNRRLTVNYGLRFDHYGKPYNPTYGMAVFDPTKYSNDPSQLNDNTGVFWHAMDSSYPSSGSPSRLLFYSPRLGASFDVFGNGRTVIRGGWGKYRNFDFIQGNQYVNPAQTGYGSISWSCGWNDQRCPSWEDVDLHSTTAVFGQGLGPGLKGISVMDYKNDEVPLVTTYSVSIDQKLPGKLTAEISYVGNRGNYNSWSPDINAIPQGQLFNPKTGCGPEDGGCQQLNRPLQNYQAINDTTNYDGNKSKFDSLQASLQRNVGFATLLLNYTWSKNFATNGEGDGYADYGGKEYFGVSPINRAQALSTAYVFRLPSIHEGNSFLKGAVNNWEISGITQVESGANVTSALNFFLNYSQDNGTAADGSTIYNDNIGKMGTNAIQLMPVITCNPKSNLKPGQYLNGDCFAPAPGNGVNGTTGLPMLAGPMFWNSDITLLKNFKITERQNLQFRIAAFNFLNHSLPSFVTNDNNIQLQWDASGKLKNSSFGYTDAYYGHRIVELGLKYSF